MKKILLHGSVFILILLLSACSGRSSDQSSSGNDQLSTDDAVTEETEKMPGEASDSVSDNADSADTAPGDTARKIIRNATLDLEAENADSSYAVIVKQGDSLGGYENNYNIEHHDGYSVIHAEYKIPSEKLAPFLEAISKECRIVNSRLDSADITDDYYDTETRLKTTKNSLDRYYALLEKADTVEEIIQLQQTIDGITAEIEAYEGKLKVWNHMTNMSTVSMIIRQENDPIKLRKDVDWNALSIGDVGYLIKNGFQTILNVIVLILEWLLILVVSTLPLWLPVISGIFIYRRYRKAHPKNKNTEKNSPPPNQGKKDD